MSRQGATEDAERCALFRVRDLVTAPESKWLPSERHMALAIADHMNKGEECFPGVRALAAWTGYNRTTVIRLLRVICGAGPKGIFERMPGSSTAGGKRTPTHYYLKASLPVAGRDRLRSATGGTTHTDRSHGASRPVAPRTPTGRTTHTEQTNEQTIEGTKEQTNGAAAVAAAAGLTLVTLPAKDPTWNQRAVAVVTERYGGTAPGGRITRALRPLVTKHGEEAVLSAWAHCVEDTPAEYLSPEKFATTYNRWTEAGARAPRNGAGKLSVGDQAIENARQALAAHEARGGR